MSLISFSQVSKFFGTVAAVNNVSFDIEAGEMVALLGPNGAGKTTIIEMILGLKSPTQGEISILGSRAGSAEAKKYVGTTPQDLSFPPHLKVIEILNWIAKIYKTSVDSSYLEKFGLQSFSSQLAGSLSGGQCRRLGLAIAFLGHPRAVILDEPTTGLDVDGKIKMWAYLEEFRKQGGSVILTTHDLYELSRLHCRMLLIDQGKLLREGHVHELISRCDYKRVSFYCSSKLRFETPCELKESQGQYVIWTLHAEQLVRELAGMSVNFSELQIQVGEIDQVFRLLRSGS